MDAGTAALIALDARLQEKVDEAIRKQDEGYEEALELMQLDWVEEE